MVWGGICGDQKTLYRETNITAQRYIDQVVQTVVLPFLQQQPHGMLFQQDNARHTAGVTMDFLHRHNASLGSSWRTTPTATAPTT